VVLMRIIVIGGSGLAEQVADALHRAGDEVTVIDTEPGRESALAKAGLRAVRGDALVPATLEAAGALRADVLVSCTRSDEDNLVISLLAKKHFNVPRVIARVNDPANDELFDQSWGVDALVSPATALVSMIRQTGDTSLPSHDAAGA
jgi:trk/ktr system potassium uptake protein